MIAPNSDERFIVKNLADVAAFLGISRRQVQEYMSRGCPGVASDPGKQNGRFNLSEIVQWCRENIWRPPKETSTEDLEVEELKTDVATKRLKLMKLAGELVDRKVESADRKRVFNIIRNRLDAVPRELANLLPPDLRTDFLIDAQNQVALIQKELTVVDRVD